MAPPLWVDAARAGRHEDLRHLFLHPGGNNKAFSAKDDTVRTKVVLVFRPCQYTALLELADCTPCFNLCTSAIEPSLYHRTTHFWIKHDGFKKDETTLVYNCKRPMISFILLFGKRSSSIPEHMIMNEPSRWHVASWLHSKLRSKRLFRLLCLSARLLLSSFHDG